MDPQHAECNAVADCIMQMVFAQNRPDGSAESVAALAAAFSLIPTRNPFAADERALPFHPSHNAPPMAPESDTKQPHQRRHSLFGRRRVRERPLEPIEHYSLDMDVSSGTSSPADSASSSSSSSSSSFSDLPPLHAVSPAPPSDGGLCTLCSRRPREFVLQACGHYYLCSDCLSHSRHEGRVKCAYCRKESEGTLRVFEC